MSTARPKKSSATDQDAIPQVPQSSTPVSLGGHSGLDAAFIWQQLSEIQKSLGSINAKLDQHKDMAAKLESDVGKVKADVAEFKQIRHTAKVVAWIVGVAAAALIGLVGFIAKEAWTAIKPLAMQQIQAAPTGQPQIAAPPAPSPKN